MSDDDAQDPSGPTAAAVLANPDLDPDLAAKLQRWFGGTGEGTPPQDDSAGEVAQPPIDQLSGDDEVNPASLTPSERIAASLEHADLDLVARIVDHDYTITRDHRAAAQLHTRKQMRGFTPLVTPKLRFPTIRREEVPRDIEDALKEENTPQALLRDLHRIEWDFDHGQRRPLKIPRGSASTHRIEWNKALAAYDKARQAPTIDISPRSGREALELIREIIKEGFHKPDSDSREESDDEAV